MPIVLIKEFHTIEKFRGIMPVIKFSIFIPRK